MAELGTKATSIVVADAAGDRLPLVDAADLPLGQDLRSWWARASDDAVAAVMIDDLVSRFIEAFGGELTREGRAALPRLATACHGRGAACVVCGESHP